MKNISEHEKIRNRSTYLKQKTKITNQINKDYNNNYINIIEYFNNNYIDISNKLYDIELDKIKHKRNIKQKYNDNHPDHVMKMKIWRSNYSKELKRNERLEVIYYYSNGSMKCKHCNETHTEFLEVDHIDNNGNTHRKENKIGPNLNWWIIKNNFPEMFQILCSNCNIKKYKNILKAHRSIKQNRSERSVLKNKIKVFKHYGGDTPKCECCKEDDIDKLTLDHIEGNGADHKRRIGGSSYLIYDIIKNNYPNGYRILCQNCNSSIGRHGYCPHKHIKTSI